VLATERSAAGGDLVRTSAMLCCAVEGRNCPSHACVLLCWGPSGVVTPLEE
jgi:hypothetical protein